MQTTVMQSWHRFSSDGSQCQNLTCFIISAALRSCARVLQSIEREAKISWQDLVLV